MEICLQSCLQHQHYHSINNCILPLSFFKFAYPCFNYFRIIAKRILTSTFIHYFLNNIITALLYSYHNVLLSNIYSL